MKLESYTCLNSKIAVYVPSTVDVNKSDSKAREKWIEKFSFLFSNLFGGCTAQKAVGSWISEKHGLVKEDVTIIYAYATKALIESNLGLILDTVQSMCVDMSQDCISLEYNSKLYFVDKD